MRLTSCGIFKSIIKSMGIVDLLSRRKKQARGEPDPPLSQDRVPQTLRNQVVFLWLETIGNIKDHFFGHRAMAVYQQIYKTLCMEYGSATIGHGFDAAEALLDFFQNATDEQALDAIELSFRVIQQRTQGYEYQAQLAPAKTCEDAINELNRRMLAAGVGYQYISQQLVPVESELTANEITRPALLVLHDQRFSGANDELLRAFEHYRHGRTKECLNECLKAFESTLKSICTGRRWKYDPNATAKKLIEIVFSKNLVPAFLTSEFTSLQSLLESGVPTVRNRLGGHGQGIQPIQVPQYFASFALNLTTSTILFLINADTQNP